MSIEDVPGSLAFFRSVYGGNLGISLLGKQKLSYTSLRQEIEIYRRVFNLTKDFISILLIFCICKQAAISKINSLY